MFLPLVLVDDPTRHVPFDLVRTLRGCPGSLDCLVEPLSASSPPPSDADALAAACAATAGSPVALPRYRAQGVAGSRRGKTEFAAAGTADALVAFVRPPFVLVVFVSRATLPLVEALHADPRTRGLLRIGITGWRLDPDYNMAQKLLAQGKLDYHEHAMTLERTLCQRLERMLQAHAARGRREEAAPAAAPDPEATPPAAPGPPAEPPSATGPRPPAPPPSATAPPGAASGGDPVSAST